MLRTRRLNCQACGSEFETSAPGKISYCGSKCRYEAKKKRHAGYVHHKCKTCGKIVARYVASSAKAPPEQCVPCRENRRVVKKIAEYTCEYCSTIFVANYEKKYCDYTCKSNAEKNGVVYHTGDCRVCGTTEVMPQWRIEVSGLICGKCATRDNAKRNAYALSHKKKPAACASCVYGQRESQSTTGYICIRAIAADCRPLGQALHYRKQK